MAKTFDTPLLTPFETLAEYERQSLAHVAGLPEQAEAPGLWRGIGFRIGTRYLVSSISEVNEILTWPALTLVPGTRQWLLGIANVRGNLVPVIDLKLFLGVGRTELSETSRVLLAKQHGGHVGLLVDEVLGQRNIAEEQRIEAQVELDNRYDRYVTENFQLGEVPWGLFSIAALVKTPDFLQAAG